MTAAQLLEREHQLLTPAKTTCSPLRMRLVSAYKMHVYHAIVFSTRVLYVWEGNRAWDPLLLTFRLVYESI